MTVPLNFFALVLFCFSLCGCSTLAPIRPPKFEYAKLAKQFFNNKPEEHFALTIQHGSNLHPETSDNGYMFFTSDVEGSQDIWMRELKSTVNLPLIKHPAEQYRPTVSQDGKKMIFVSEDRDSKGDLRIISLNPKRIVQGFLKGISQLLLWSSSSNLSNQMEKWASENLPPKCHGSFGETEPRLHPKGNILLFSSDRCEKETYNIWLAKLKGKRIKFLVQLTKKGGAKPDLHPYKQQIAFVSYRNQYTRGNIYILDFSNLQKPIERPVLIPTEKNNLYYNDNPHFIENGSYLAYTSIRKDTNLDKIIDPNDAAGIYRVQLKDIKPKNSKSIREEQLLESEAPLYDLHYSKNDKGFILYSSNLYQDINIYLLPSRGVIPYEQNIESQYLRIKQYEKDKTKRYALSLQAVQDRFGNEPEYILYGFNIYIQLLEYYKKNKYYQKFKKVEKELKQKIARNPYLKFRYKIYQKKKSRKSLIQDYLKFQDILKKSKFFNKENKDIITSSILLSLAKEYLKENQKKKALKVLKYLHSNYLDFHKDIESYFLQAKLEFEFTKNIPPILNEVAKNPNLPLSVLEKIHGMIYDFYTKRINPKKRKNIIQTQLKKATASSLHSLIQNSLQLALAYHLLHEDNFEEASKICFRLQSQIPKVKSVFRSIPKLGWSGLYIHTWLLIEKIYQKQGNQQLAFTARAEAAANYNKITEIKLNPEDFKDLIQSTRNNIEVHLKTARSLFQIYKRYKLLTVSRVRKLQIRGKTKSQEAVQSDEQQLIKVNGTDIELLSDLCKNFSSDNPTIQKLDVKYIRLYSLFCKEYKYQNYEPSFHYLHIKQIQLAVQLLYGISYTSSHVLNILFFNMRRLGFLESLYEKKSFEYQRLEADIAAEQNEVLNEVLPKSADLSLISGEVNIYKSNAFERMEKNRRLLFTQASLNQDLASLYGYAYVLIKKNVQKERFYFKLDGKVNEISPKFLQQGKKKILHDFKNAELLLKYIINSDAQNINAYLLLGWLYQYIDGRKETIIKYQRSLLAQIFTQKPKKRKDGNLYNNLYEIYFPSNFYEINIELYLRILRRINLQTIPKVAMFRIYLNLANNYFVLLNFRDASSYYQKIQNSLIKTKVEIFENERQKFLFYFNFARSLLGQGKYQQAIKYFHIAYRLYQTTTHNPLKEKFQKIHSSTDSNGYTNVSFSIEQEKMIVLKDLSEKLNRSRFRMAMISALLGLTYWQSGESRKAVSWYTKSSVHIYKEGEPLPDYLNLDGLFNFLALAHKDSGMLIESDEKAKLAGELAQKKGLKKDNSRYEPRTYCGRSLGCLINFGEDFSIIGPSRNPYGFSPLRQKELSLSILLENMISRGNTLEATRLIQRQRRIFRKYDLDVKHGKTGYLNSLNHEGFQWYQKGNYLKAASFFKKAGDIANSFKNLIEYKKSYSAYFKAILSFLEYDISDRRADKEIGKYLKILKKFEDNYRKNLRKNFIKKRKAEFPGYQFQEKRDGKTLNTWINKQFHDIRIIEASLYFYKNQLHLEARKGQEKSHHQEDLLKAISLFQNIIDDMKISDKKSTVLNIRLQYNMARLLIADGQIHEAKNILENTVQKSYELHFIREEILLRLLACRVLKEMKSYYSSQTKKYELALAGHMERIINIFYNHSYLYELFQKEERLIRDTVVNYFLERKNPDKALELIEKTWSIYLQWNYFRFSDVFQEPKRESLHQNVQAAESSLKDLNEQASLLRIEGKSVKDILKAKNALEKKRKKLILNLRRLEPSHYAFLQADFNPLKSSPSLKKEKFVLRLFHSQGKTSCWCFSPKKKNFYESSISDTYTSLQAKGKIAYQFLLNKSVSQVIQKCLQTHTPKDIVLIHDEIFSSTDFRKIISKINPELPVPLYTTSIHNPLRRGMKQAQQDDNTKSNLDLLQIGPSENLARKENFSDNIISLNILGENSPVSYTMDDENLDDNILSPFHIHNWMRQKNSTVFALAYPKEDNISYRKISFLYEALRAGNVKTLAVASFINKRESTFSFKKAISEMTGNKLYSQMKGFRIYGFPGFEKEFLKESAQKNYENAYKRGILLEKQKNYQKAKQLYNIASRHLYWCKNKKEKSKSLELAHLRIDIYLNPVTFDKNIVKRMILYAIQIKDKEYEEQIYKTLIRLLFKVQNAKSAKSYFEAYQKSFPGKLEQIQKKYSHLEFIYRLRQRFYSDKLWKNQRFFKDFNLVSEQLSSISNQEIIWNLIRHNSYQEAFTLLEKKKNPIKSNRNKLDSRESKIFTQIIALEKYFLGISSVIPKTKSKIPFFRMLRVSSEENWSLERNIFDPSHRSANLPPPRSAFAKSLPSSELNKIYLLWKKFIRDSYTSVIEGKAKQKEKTNSFKNQYLNHYFQLLQRIYRYHLFLQNLSWDRDSKTAEHIKEMIQSEGEESSYNKMSFMALLATEKYLQQLDFVQADIFFKIYLKTKKYSIPNQSTSLRESEIGIILGSYKYRPMYLSHQEKWEITFRKKYPDLLYLKILKKIREYPFSKGEIKELNEYLKQEGKKKSQSSLSNLTLAISLIQQKAIRSKKWISLTNFSFLKEKIQLYDLKNQQDKDFPIYESIAEQIQKKIPQNQTFLALIDVPQSVIRISISSKSIYSVPLTVTGQYLHTGMYHHLSLQKQAKQNDFLYNELVEHYSNFIFKNFKGIVYLWLPGIHSFAPINPKFNELFFQVANLKNFLRSPVQITGKEFSKSFQVIPLGKPLPPKDIISKKIAMMERLALRKEFFTTEKPTLPQLSIYHIYLPLQTGKLQPFMALLKKKITAEKNTWLLSSIYPNEKITVLRVQNYNRFLSLLGSTLKKPGVIHLGDRHQLSYAYFISYFYDPAQPYPSLGKRFTKAQELAQQKPSVRLEKLNSSYRLFTGSFLKLPNADKKPKSRGFSKVERSKKR